MPLAFCILFPLAALPVLESPSYLMSIANRPDIHKPLRRDCVLYFFERHVSPGMRLSDVGKILHNPAWLRSEEVSTIGIVAGLIPVTFTFEDTAFDIRVFPELENEMGAVYFSVSGQINRGDIVRLLRGQTPHQAKDPRILEIATVGPNGEILQVRQAKAK